MKLFLVILTVFSLAAKTKAYQPTSRRRIFDQGTTATTSFWGTTTATTSSVAKLIETCPKKGSNHHCRSIARVQHPRYSTSLFVGKDSDSHSLLMMEKSTNDTNESLLSVSLNQRQDEALSLPGLFVLATVPLVWGTYVPIVRLLYEIDPPIPGYIFSAAYFGISAVTTTVLANLFAKNDHPSRRPSDDNTNLSTDQTQTLAGLELGSWIFMGNTLQLLGLETVSSDRAGFLVQCESSSCRT
jgi:hypothetical protein